MRVLDFILVAILLALLGVGLYILYQNLPISAGPPQSASYTFSSADGNYSKGGQFYSNMRYPDKRVSYKIESSCGPKKQQSVEQAFQIISNKTVLTFYSVENNPEIDILCSNLAPSANEKGHFVAGEGGPSEIVNNSIFSVILFGKIALYRAETCSTPHIAIHEIFHALGFDHNNNPKSIMYPVTACDQEIDDYLVEDIASLYSLPSLPDLAIESVKATKNDRYLDFNITIINAGLKDSQSSELLVIADGSQVKSFEVNSTGIGIRQRMEVQNLRVSKSTKKIDFSASTNEQELSKTNNNAEILLS